MALTQYEKEPDVWKPALISSLEKIDAHNDQELLAIANKILEALDSEKKQRPNINIQADNNKGIVAGVIKGNVTLNN